MSTEIHSCSHLCDRPECIKAQRDELLVEVAHLKRLLYRYRHESPPGNQPYMICHEADAALTQQGVNK